MCHWRLANGANTEILSFIDDRSRYALNVSAHNHINTPKVIAVFRETADQHGYPASVLSDNAMYYTARFARGGASSPNRFETLLNELGIQQKHSRPNHPTTCGKVERFQQTLKKWLTAQTPAANLNQLQNQLNNFTDTYNNHRPHRSLNRAVPTDIYTQLPKTTPNTEPTSQHRIRHDHVDTYRKVTLRHNGKLHHIGIGRKHAHTPVIMLINNLNIRIINQTTGQLLRQLTLNPNRDYQPQNQT
ncbi:MAG: integrase core domain-containing protein [Acidimicrobiaceae bacterium]|nr:integrase core domain-containing protein [Acidimicrobiaceae bacterium]